MLSYEKSTHALKISVWKTIHMFALPYEKKLQKYAFLKQNCVKRIDEVPYHSSFFYKLNFVLRRQFFMSMGEYL